MRYAVKRQPVWLHHSIDQPQVEGSSAMQAHSPDPSISTIPASHAEESKAAHLLYQWAIVVAVLLFLISFWSC
jgi:hypothetical protein